MAYQDYKLQKDQQTINRVLRQIEKIVGNDSGKSGEGNLRSRVFNSRFESAEANRLRMKYVELNTFQESWIPLIKSGGFNRFSLHDLHADPTQKKEGPP